MPPLSRVIDPSTPSRARFRIAACAWTDAVTLGEVVCLGRIHFTQLFAGGAKRRATAAAVDLSGKLRQTGRQHGDRMIAAALSPLFSSGAEL
jgi:hypothetical protein